MESAAKCAKAIVKSACRGDKYLVEPFWINSLYVLKVLCPELVEFCNHILFIICSKKIAAAAAINNGLSENSSTSKDPKLDWLNWSSVLFLPCCFHFIMNHFVTGERWMLRSADLKISNSILVGTNLSSIIVLCCWTIRKFFY